jgi:AraC family transcriptional regulator
MLHDEPPAALRVAALAQAVDVHPAHLARTFRERFGLSIGAYARRRRLEWAAARLARSDGSADLSLAALAAEAGFADQSHFTRAFKRWAGLTPDRYRQRSRLTPGATPPAGPPAAAR